MLFERLRLPYVPCGRLSRCIDHLGATDACDCAARALCFLSCFFTKATRCLRPDFSAMYRALCGFLMRKSPSGSTMRCALVQQAADHMKRQRRECD